VVDLSNADPPLFQARTPPAEPVESAHWRIPTGVPPVASSNFKAFVMLEGVAQIHGSFGIKTVQAGDLVLMNPGVKAGSLSLSPVQVITAYFHPGFVIEQMRWSRPLSDRNSRSLFDQISRWIGGLRSIALESHAFDAVRAHFTLLSDASLPHVPLGDRIARATELIWSLGDILCPPSSLVPFETTETTPRAIRKDVSRALSRMHSEHSTRLRVADLGRVD